MRAVFERDAQIVERAVATNAETVVEVATVSDESPSRTTSVPVFVVGGNRAEQSQDRRPSFRRRLLARSDSPTSSRYDRSAQSQSPETDAVTDADAVVVDRVENVADGSHAAQIDDRRDAAAIDDANLAARDACAAVEGVERRVGRRRSRRA